ncbi:MAG TPA: hypothetical protein VLN59_10790, partial [Burkholderiales bacterium]|nr:hypothetical protein [Burkholderiales bacterium]
MFGLSGDNGAKRGQQHRQRKAGDDCGLLAFVLQFEKSRSWASNMWMRPHSSSLKLDCFKQS